MAKKFFKTNNVSTLKVIFLLYSLIKVLADKRIITIDRVQSRGEQHEMWFSLNPIWVKEFEQARDVKVQIFQQKLLFPEKITLMFTNAWKLQTLILNILSTKGEFYLDLFTTGVTGLLNKVQTTSDAHLYVLITGLSESTVIPTSTFDVQTEFAPKLIQYFEATTTELLTDTTFNLLDEYAQVLCSKYKILYEYFNSFRDLFCVRNVPVYETSKNRYMFEPVTYLVNGDTVITSKLYIALFHILILIMQGIKISVPEQYVEMLEEYLYEVNVRHELTPNDIKLLMTYADIGILDDQVQFLQALVRHPMVLCGIFNKSTIRQKIQDCSFEDSIEGTINLIAGYIQEFVYNLYSKNRIILLSRELGLFNKASTILSLQKPGYTYMLCALGGFKYDFELFEELSTCKLSLKKQRDLLDVINSVQQGEIDDIPLGDAVELFNSLNVNQVLMERRGGITR